MRKFLLFLGSLFFAGNCFAAAATMYVTASGAGLKDGTSWANAMSLSEWETDAEGSTEAGDTYYVMEGTYTLTSDFNVVNDGTYTNPIKVYGVKSGTTAEPPTYSDWAWGDDRPYITDGGSGYGFIWDDYAELYNLRVTSSATIAAELDQNTLAFNLKILNNSATSNRAGLYTNANGLRMIICDLASTNGYALQVHYTNYSFLYKSYLHDSSVGLKNDGRQGITAVGLIIDDCTKCVQHDGGDSNYFVHCTFNGSTIGADHTDAFANTYIDNIFSNLGTCFNVSLTDQGSMFDYNNCFYNYTNLTSGYTMSGFVEHLVNPGFDDADNEDFDIGSALDDLGLDVPGDSSSSHMEIGACMYEETSGGGGSSEHSYGFAN